MTEKTVLKFTDLGLSSELLKAVEKKGFTEPSLVQAGIIPLLLNGEKDIIGQSQTGTGKTASFALPLLQKLDNFEKKTQAIILAPTRELAIQVAKEIESFSVDIENSPTVAVVYGGNHMREEIKVLNNFPNIVVGTPGRMQHHIRNGNLKLDDVKYFVLDEADEMLNFGFRDEIVDILNMTPSQRRVLLFSATMPQAIMNIVKNYMKEYDMVKVKAEETTNKNISQEYYVLRDTDKFEALRQIIESNEKFYAIVFCRTKLQTDIVARNLINKRLNAEALHGDIDQEKREKILGRFRKGETTILVATDVAARGIDVIDLNFVINYNLPENHEIYTHRVGRTGRAGKMGHAITFVNGSEVNSLKFFEKKLGVEIEKGILLAPEAIVEKKKQHLISRITNIINNKDETGLEDLANLLLKEGTPEEVINALLYDFYKFSLNSEQYGVIVEDRVGFSNNSRGNFRGRGGYRGKNNNSRRSSGKRYFSSGNSRR